MTDDTLSIFRRIVSLGVHFLDAVDVYAWGVDREFAAFRAACTEGVRVMNGRERPALEAARRGVALVATANRGGSGGVS